MDNAERIRLDIQKKSIERQDGWTNIYTRQGTSGIDKQTGARLTKDLRLTEDDNRNLYRGDGFGRKVVDRPVGDMVREWFNVTNDTDGAINNFLINELDAKKHVRSALTWAKVFGGSLVVMGIDDGSKDLEAPLNENNIRSFGFLRVYDCHRVQWVSSDLYSDPAHPKFGEPEFYSINPLQPTGTSLFRVHESRVLRFCGVHTDDKTRSENNWWEDSVYQAIFEQLHNLNGAYFSSKNIIDDFIQIILQIDNLQQMIAAGQDDLVKQRLNIIDQGRHIMNTIMLDSKEQYSKEASSVSGLDKLLQEFGQALSAVTDIPMTVLMGRSPAGQNSTGDSDIQLYYDNISDKQENEMLQSMNRLVFLVQKTKEGPTKGKEIDGWSIEFNPLWQLSEKEIAEMKKVTAESDAIYINWGVVDPREVRDARFGGNEYSSELQVDGDVDLDTERNDSHSFALAGVTSTIDQHNHDYVITDPMRGIGHTSPSGKDKHVHQILNFEIQSMNDHTHELQSSTRDS